MAESTVLTVRLDPHLKQRLEALANCTKRSKSFLAAEAIAAYVELNTWQVAKVEEGLRQADAGEFMSDEEVAEAYQRWTS